MFMKEFLKKIIVKIITFEARIVLKKHKPKIVAVTGSVGKTSTKDAIAAVLGGSFSLRKSTKSYNSEIGVPLTVLGCENAWLNPFLWFKNIIKGAVVFFRKDYPKWLVLEIGVEKPKDMENLVSWLEPHIAVVTALSEIPPHVEFFASPQSLAAEKAKLVKTLGVHDWVILNSDDDTVYSLKENTKARIATIGFSSGADFVASAYNISRNGIVFRVDHNGHSVPIRLYNALGKHHVYPALVALAVGDCAGLNIVEMAESLSLYEPPPGRLKLLEGVKGSLILDDTYNSSPLALRAALEVLKDMRAERKIVVLGDMLELGKYAIEAHRSSAEFVIDAGAELVFLAGPRSKFTAVALREKGFNPENIFEFSDSEQVEKEVEKVIKEGDLILVKGSQSMRMEKIVEEIMAHPEDKDKLLVRQEKEWKER